jgi:transaldolase
MSGGDISKVFSVASFFVSRVDTEVDKRLNNIIETSDSSVLAERARSLLGQIAVAQARVAYGLFKDKFNQERFVALKTQGAKAQKPLWASTSTKNPNYPDLLYVDELIGPDTVNTMPRATVDGFLDHGKVERTLDGLDKNGGSVLENAESALDALAEIGISLADVTEQLETEGVASFSKSFEDLMRQLNGKVNEL